MSLATPLASIADALVPAAALLALKYPLLIWAYRRMRGGSRGGVAHFAALWAGRIAAMLAILPALRLLFLGTGDGLADGFDPRAPGIALAILCLGAAAMLADDLIAGALQRRFEARPRGIGAR